MKTEWYSHKILELLRKNFLPGAKYMNEPKISRYLNLRTIQDAPAKSAKSGGK